MINKTTYIVILLLLCLSVKSQSITTSILLKTDRTSYVSGDDILFCTFTNNNFKDTVPGHDVHVDLTDVNNDWIVGTGTIARQDSIIASGSLPIPDSLSSGYYKIRAYTNYPNLDNYYCSKEIYVSNRFGNHQPHVMRSQQNLMQHSISGNVITIDKNEYKPNAKVNLSFTDKCTNGVLRIISKKQWDEESEPIIGKCPDYNIDEKFASMLPYNGIIVTGTVTDAESDSPITDAIVLVSLQDSIVRMKYDITDSTGTFCVLLHNYFGVQQVFINAFNQQLEPYFNAKITLKKQFGFKVDEPVNLSEATVKIDSSELDKAVIAKAFDIHQYSSDNNILDRPALSYDNFMVGELRHSVLTSDYISFSNMKEITREILKFVRIRKNNGVQEMHVVNDNGIANPNKAFVLVDGISLTMLDKIMDNGSDKIKKVDTQNSPRHFGNIAFNNGLVMIWTNKLDFWNKCQVPGTYSFLVQNFQQPVVASESKSESKDKVPNLKQTIYWNPNINASSQNSIEIPLSDETGDFVIEFFGIGNDGKYINDFELINVK